MKAAHSSEALVPLELATRRHVSANLNFRIPCREKVKCYNEVFFVHRDAMRVAAIVDPPMAHRESTGEFSHILNFTERVRLV